MAITATCPHCDAAQVLEPEQRFCRECRQLLSGGSSLAPPGLGDPIRAAWGQQARPWAAAVPDQRAATEGDLIGAPWGQQATPWPAAVPDRRPAADNDQPRPGGVTWIAFSLAVSALYYAYIAFQVLSLLTQPGMEATALGMISCIALPVLMLAAGLLARGMWGMEEWARKGFFYFVGIDFLFAMPFIFTNSADTRSSIGPLVVSVVRTLLCVRYLMGDSIAARFH